MTDPLVTALIRLVSQCRTPEELTARVTQSFGIGQLGRARTIAYETKGRDWLYPPTVARPPQQPLPDAVESSTRAWVYVLSNRSMPGLVKVGFSTKPPSQRAQQLEGTGVRHPFKVEYHVLAFNARAVEQAAYKLLAGRREGKEFFRVSVEEAKAAIDSARVAAAKAAIVDKRRNGDA